MKVFGRAVTIVLAIALAAFCALNWTALTLEQPLNLGVLQPQAPFGLVLLGLSGALVVWLLLLMLAGALSRRNALQALHEELRTAKGVAERAEASRLEGMQHLVATEFRMLNERISALQSSLAAKREQSEPLVKSP